MTNIRRYYIPNSMIFITTVTRNRNPIFYNDKNIEILENTIEKVKELYQFDVFAYSFLPDHFHILDTVN